MSLFNFWRKKKRSERNNFEAICPYCNKQLSKFPGRKTKCPHCGNFIYVRTKPDNGSRILIKEDQIEKIEQEWQHHFNVEDFKDRIKSECDFSFDKKYDDIKSQLIKKFGFEPAEEDALWGLSNCLLSEFMKKGDWQKMKMIYSAQASFLYLDGKDHLRILQESAKCDLREYIKQGFVEKVEIVTCKENSCPSCQKLSGKIFTIEQALKEMPIPERSCSFDANSKLKKGWCRCIYAPVVE